MRDSELSDPAGFPGAGIEVSFDEPEALGTGAASSGSTVTAKRTGCPKADASASSSQVRSRPSNRPRVNSSPTAMIAVFSCRASGLLASSHTRWLGGRSSRSSRQTVLSSGALLGRVSCESPPKSTWVPAPLTEPCPVCVGLSVSVSVSVREQVCVEQANGGASRSSCRPRRTPRSRGLFPQVYPQVV